jgi:hypothetical protein
MALQNFLRQLGFWTTVERWREPLLYRVRLKGDLLLRLLMAFAVGAAATFLLLALFAINVNPPNPAFALFGMLVAGGLALMLLTRGSSTAGGNVRLCQEGICRKRNFVGFTAQWFEDAKWPFEHIEQCVIVPGQAIGESFSLLFLSGGGELEMIGVPSRVDLPKLAQFLSTKGLAVQQGTYVPPAFTRGMNMPLALASAAMGFLLLVSGLAFYLVKALPIGQAEPAVAERPFGGIDAPRRPRYNRTFPPDAQPPQANAPTSSDSSPAPSDGSAEPSADTPAAGATPPASVPGLPPEIPSRRRAPFSSRIPSPAAPSRPPDRSAAAQNRSAGTRTELAGGAGGFPFELRSPTQQPVLGFRYTLGNWAGTKALAQLQPLFKPEPAADDTVVARDGYVVSGLEIDAEKFVQAVRVVFARRAADGRLDSGDTYTSPWLGTPTNRPPQTLTAGSLPVIGVHGRRGALIDALGLVVASGEAN